MKVRYVGSGAVFWLESLLKRLENCHKSRSEMLSEAEAAGVL